MMNKQFFYTRKARLEPKEGETEIQYSEFLDSFSLDMVIRSLEMEDGRRLVLLNDIHERTIAVPDINTKTNAVKSVKRERNTYQSEIYLEPEDNIKFKAIYTKEYEGV